MDILKTVHDISWADSAHLVERSLTQDLEEGKIIFLPQLAFELKPEEHSLLSPVYSNGKAKNISFNVHKGSLTGAKASPEEASRLMGMMNRFAVQATKLAQGLFPAYASHLEVGRTSYRPVEILGRKSPSYRKDDTLLHVDAFPASPNQGRRILRIFSNINPHGQPRLWRVGESFENVARNFLPRIQKPWIKGWLLNRLGLTKGIRTDYDHIMLQIHNKMKADLAYQQKTGEALKLPAGSTWIVKTDVVSHAALSGQFVLEQTFYLPVGAMENQEASPLRILEKLVRKKLI